jgi:LysR family transcriptional regulator, regulator for genes of the gallate degradation pathway
VHLSRFFGEQSHTTRQYVAHRLRGCGMTLKLDISLRHLRAFLTVADTGSIAAAAKSAKRAQSAIARSLKEIETHLSIKLFDRTRSGMALTVYGKALAVRARAVAEEFKLARETLSTGKTQPSAPVFDMLFSEQRLLIFITLAERRHMQTTAKVCGVSQPAVSTAIGDLEGSLGFPLFLRTAKGMLLTQEGEILLFRTKRAFAELRNVSFDIAALQGNVTGKVVVGSHPLSRASILPLAIARLHALYPNVSISTEEGSSDELISGVRSGDFDFILNTWRPGQQTPDLTDEHLIRERLVIFVRSGHPLTSKHAISSDDLLQSNWVLPARRTTTRELLDNAFRTIYGHTPRCVIETSDLLVLRRLLLSSDLVTAVSPQQIDLEINTGLVQPISFDLPHTDRVILLTQRAHCSLSPGASLLATAIREIAAELNAKPLSRSR